jgi:hypothetical protein
MGSPIVVQPDVFLVGARLGAVDVHVARRGGEAGGDAVEVLSQEDLAA